MFCARKLFRFSFNCVRNVSTKPTNILEKLPNRSLISISGQNVDEYLQGLITNDIQHLAHGAGSMYAMLLNTKGRVLYDVIIYRTDKENSYLIECDTESVYSLQKHLKMYRVRRKIDISSLKDDFNIYALFNIDSVSQVKHSNKIIPRDLEGLIVPCTQLKETLPEGSHSCKIYKDLTVYIDPRVIFLGNRIIAPADCNVHQQLSELFNVQVSTESKQSYRWFRYKLGIGEGIKDLPPGNCFPLECNCDYLHGVSFHKGCYIGQELTARTHHTGVVRKRLMPLEFSKVPTDISEEYKIAQDGKRLGVLRGIKEDIGIAILKVSDVLEMKEFKVGNGLAKTEKPLWWPLEASKEKILQKG